MITFVVALFNEMYVFSEKLRTMLLIFRKICTSRVSNRALACASLRRARALACALALLVFSPLFKLLEVLCKDTHVNRTSFVSMRIYLTFWGSPRGVPPFIIYIAPWKKETIKK